MTQATMIARCELAGRRTKNHAFDAISMSLPEKLRNRTAHRISNAKEAIDPELLRQSRDVICTISKPEGRANPHPASVPTMIDDENSIGAPERLENGSPIE
jgi:hypothetical protein